MRNTDVFLKPMPPSLQKASEQPEACGIDGWAPSTDPSTGRMPEFGMGLLQVDDTNPVCGPNCVENDDAA